jgi:hypothetical protein
MSYFPDYMEVHMCYTCVHRHHVYLAGLEGGLKGKVVCNRLAAHLAQY